MSDETNATPDTAAAPSAPASRNRRWPMWVAGAAIALLILATGVRIGGAFAGPFGPGGMRAGFGAAAMQGARGDVGGDVGGGVRGGSRGGRQGGSGLQQGRGRMQQSVPCDGQCAAGDQQPVPGVGQGTCGGQVCTTGTCCP